YKETAQEFKITTQVVLNKRKRKKKKSLNKHYQMRIYIAKRT
ncbi:unnamed protein product, partial [Arabidopsis halleri]